MRRSSDRRRSSGFVLLTALATFLVVTVALLALATSMSADARHTMDRARCSQLDQLLLAGASGDVDHLNQSSPHAGDIWAIELPHSLAEQHATLQSTVDSSSDPSAGQVVLHIHARIENRSAEQVLQLKKGEKGWQIVQAEIPTE